MLTKELEEYLPKLEEWIEINNILSFKPNDVSKKFDLNDINAKQLCKLAINKEFMGFKLEKRLDGNIIVIK